ncbi:MAG: hypothetical protein STSR0008_00810 [Ignavibacterium sp.]
MLKKVITPIFIVLFFSSLIIPQSKSIIEQKKKVIIENEEAQLNKSTTQKVDYIPFTSPSFDPSQGESIGLVTDYDIFTNSVVRDQIVYYNGPHFANMVRPTGTNTGKRSVVYTYFDGTNYVHTYALDTTAGRGWPHIDVALTSADIAGTIAIVGHSPSILAIWDGSAFSPSVFDPSTDPSLQIIGNTIFLGTSGDRVQFMFYKTEDFGTSFTLFDSISTWSPSSILWATNGGVEVGMSKSQNEQNLVYFGTNANGYHLNENADSADNAWVIYSNDAGANFSGKVIGQDGDFNAVPGYHTANYTPLFENFGQLDAVITNNGTIHAVANGYGLVFSGQTPNDSAIANSFPVIYWNSSSNTWKSISDPNVDNLEYLGVGYPGNGIGQSFPSISVSEDGNVLYAVWTGPEMTGTEIDTAIGGLMWSDLYHAWSFNGGNTWTYGGVLSGEKNVSENFGHAAQHLRKVGDDYVADIVYINDLSAGGNVFGEGEKTLNPIMYKTYTIINTDVNDVNLLVNSFSLEQNYPNPFNPSTTIKYTIPEKDFVTIKIYDVLGKEVASLINTIKDAGSYEVEFNAKNLSSGMYLYSIQAGKYNTTKKMILMK